MQPYSLPPFSPRISQDITIHLVILFIISQGDMINHKEEGLNSHGTPCDMINLHVSPIRITQCMTCILKQRGSQHCHFPPTIRLKPLEWISSTICISTRNTFLNLCYYTGGLRQTGNARNKLSLTSLISRVLVIV